MTIKPEEIKQLAGEYVLGTLSAKQRRDVERRRASEAELDAAILEWEAKLLPLSSLAPELEPSVKLWPRISASLKFGAHATWSWWTSLGLWRGLSAGGFAMTAVLAVVLLTQSPPQTRYVVVLAAPQDKTPGWLIQSSLNNTLKLIPLVKQEVPEGKSLQFWTKGEGWNGPVSLGLVQPGQSLEVQLDKLPPLQANQLFEITVEPYAGSPLNRPTGPVAHIGRAVTVM